MKTIVYIDGQNFLYKVASVLIASNIVSSKQDITSFDIRGLIAPLFPEDSLEIRYYGIKKITHGVLRYDADIEEKARLFADSLRRLKNYLRKNGVLYIPKGALKLCASEPCKNCGYRDFYFQEKGVDVGVATDIVRDIATRKDYRLALVSSDTDLLPALRIAKKEGVEVDYVAFAGRETVSLKKIADRNFVIDDRSVREAYLRSIN